MARVVGRDVLVELMDTVAQLKTSQVRQDEDLERIIVRLRLMSESSASTAAGMKALSGRMDELSGRMDEISGRMDEISRRMDDEAEHLRALQQDFVQLSQHGKDTGAGLKRLSDILVRALGVTSDRFDELEERLAKLEKKTG